jgi:signal peptidase I
MTTELVASLICGGPALVFTLRQVTSALLARRLIAVTVRGRSMEPRYQDGDRVLVRRGIRPVAGQVVVVERPTVDAEWHWPPVPPTAGAVAVASREWMIKRVIAAQGDAVPRDRFAALAGPSEHRVPPKKLILLGDNQEASFDSRYVGYFPTERVLGAAMHSDDS